MGRNSYEKVLSFDECQMEIWPVVVLCSQIITIPEQLRPCVSSSAEIPTALVQRLSKQGTPLTIIMCFYREVSCS